MIRQKVEDICPDWQVYQKAAWNLSQLNLPQVVLTLGKLLLGESQSNLRTLVSRPKSHCQKNRRRKTPCA